MSEVSYYDVPRWFLLLGGKRWSYETQGRTGDGRFSWGEAAWGGPLADFALKVCDFEEHRSLHIKLLGVSVFIYLDSKHRLPAEILDSYGVSTFDRSLSIEWHGWFRWTFELPWAWYSIRREALLPDGSWGPAYVTDGRGYSVKNPDQWSETTDYEYRLESGEVQKCIATVSVSEYEWRWRALRRLPFPRRVSRSIWVDFSSEVGEQSGSWKGGTRGCGYEMRRGEDAFATLRRMSRERKFR